MKQPEINELFDLLDKWRLLPAYQLERRADIFFALYLPQILHRYLDGQPILKIIPEFPVRKGLVSTKKHPNQSVKIDYLVIAQNKVLLVELKTENTSRRDAQDKYLAEAKKANIKKLVDGLLAIFAATKSKTKYLRLLRELGAIGWLKQENGVWKNSSQDKMVEIVYIQPEKKKKDEGHAVISFDEVAPMVEKNQTPMAQRFAQSLRIWKKNTNEE